MPSEHTPQAPNAKAANAEAPKQTPSADIQPEDTGTPASGTAAEAAMKQTSKTPHETGSSDTASGAAGKGGGKP